MQDLYPDLSNPYVDELHSTSPKGFITLRLYVWPVYLLIVDAEDGLFREVVIDTVIVVISPGIV